MKSSLVFFPPYVQVVVEYISDKINTFTLRCKFQKLSSIIHESRNSNKFLANAPRFRTPHLRGKIIHYKLHLTIIKSTDFPSASLGTSLSRVARKTFAFASAAAVCNGCSSCRARNRLKMSSVGEREGSQVN